VKLKPYEGRKQLNITTWGVAYMKTKGVGNPDGKRHRSDSNEKDTLRFRKH